MSHPAIHYTGQYRRYGKTYIKVEDRHACLFLDTKTGKMVTWEYSLACKDGHWSHTKYLSWLRYSEGRPVPSKNFPYLISMDSLYGSRDPRDWAQLQDYLETQE